MNRDNNVEVLELGNADLHGSGRWEGSPPPRTFPAPIPGVYPTNADLPPDPLPEMLARHDRDNTGAAVVLAALSFGAGIATGLLL